MEKLNIYAKKYQALESFYGWVDQGSDYNIAVEQSLYYDHNMEEIDKIIFNIIVATRFCRSGRKISEEFQSRLRDIIIRAKELEWQMHGLSDEEIEEINEEIEEAESLLLY